MLAPSRISSSRRSSGGPRRGPTPTHRSVPAPHPVVSAGRRAAVRDLIRLGLGRWLALGLEFELAADILRTAVAPTWNEIGQLAAIVVLRTLLNFFLQKEIDSAARRAELVPTA